MTISADWINQHYTPAKIEHGTALACRHCGTLVWDLELHITAAHPTTP